MLKLAFVVSLVWVLCVAVEAESTKLPEVIRLEPFSALKRGKLGVMVDLTAVPTEWQARAAEVVVTVSAAGAPLDRAKFDQLPKAPFAVFFDVAEQFHDHELIFICRVTGADGECLEHSVSYQPPPPPQWLGKYEVPEDFVPHPWPALEVGDKTTITCWGRRYVFGDSPFPQHIYVGDKDILDGAVTLAVATARGTLRWDREPLNIEQQTPAKVVLSRKGRAAALNVVVRTTIEFDGFVKFEVNLTPTAPVDLNNINLIVPIHRDLARFFHVDGPWNQVRFGVLVKREDLPLTEHEQHFQTAGAGRMRSRSALAAGLQDERNYYWVGNDDMGLCWMTDGLAHWQKAPGETRVGFRETETGYEGYFLPWTRRGKLDRPLTMRFALQATPTRPPHHVPLRGYATHDTPPERFKLHVSSTKTPLLEMSLQGKFNYPPYEQDAEKIRQWIAGYHDHGFIFVAYHYISSEIGPDGYRDYWGDWLTSIPPLRTPATPRSGPWTDCCLNSSWSDAYLNNIDITTRVLGADGVYLDGTIQERVCQRSDIHGSDCDNIWPIFVSREHLKKLRHLVQRNRGERAFLWGHSSDIKAAPLAGLMDLLLEGENFGVAISYEELTADVIRAQYGAQWGPRTVIIPQLTRKNQKYEMAPERYLGLLALHDVECLQAYVPREAQAQLLYPMWRALDAFPDTEAQFLPYFKQTIVTEASGHPVSVYVSKGEDRLLLVIANRGEGSAAYQMQLQPGERGPRYIASVHDNMRNEAIPFEGNNINLTLGGGEFRLLEVKLK